jgi:hypothetical protein
MRLFAGWIENRQLVLVDGSQYPDPSVHNRAAFFGRHHKNCDRRLPRLGLLIGVAELQDIGAGVCQGQKLAAVREPNRIVKLRRPRHRRA